MSVEPSCLRQTSKPCQPLPHAVNHHRRCPCTTILPSCSESPCQTPTWRHYTSIKPQWQLPPQPPSISFHCASTSFSSLYEPPMLASPRRRRPSPYPLPWPPPSASLRRLHTHVLGFWWMNPNGFLKRETWWTSQISILHPTCLGSHPNLSWSLKYPWP